MEMRELFIQILKEEHSRKKEKPMQGLESKSILGKFKQHRGSQYARRGVIEQGSLARCQRSKLGRTGRRMDYEEHF